MPLAPSRARLLACSPARSLEGRLKGPLKGQLTPSRNKTMLLQQKEKLP